MTFSGGGDGGSTAVTGGPGAAVRVMVVDDHVLFADGLAVLLGPVSGQRVEVVGTASDIPTAMAGLDRCSPDVVLVDLNIPNGDGIALIRQIRMASADYHIAVLSGTNQIDDVDAALDAGATAFLPKSAEPADLAAAIIAINSGWCVMPASVFSVVVLDRQPPRIVRDLSETQRELLALVARGMDTNEIADSMFISDRTAKRRLTDLFCQLGVKNRTEAATLAGRAGLA